MSDLTDKSNGNWTQTGPDHLTLEEARSLIRKMEANDVHGEYMYDMEPTPTAWNVIRRLK